METRRPLFRRARRRRRWTPVLAAVFAVHAGPLVAVGRSDEAPREAYEIVAGAALTVVPDPIRPFFEASAASVIQFAAEVRSPDSPPSNAEVSGEGHFIMLDVGADAQDWAASRDSARRFPHDQASAAAMAKDHRIRAGGLLPWVVQDRYRGLVDAFRSREPERIVRATGELLCFVADACLPFNTTTDRDGTVRGHLHWPAPKADNAASDHRTVRHRCHVGLIRRFRRQFEYEVRVWPNRFRHLSEPAEATFDTLLDAHHRLPELLAADADIISRLGITDAGTFLASSEAYYTMLMNHVGATMEAQLEAGALLGANLVGSAWTEAGSPPISSLVARESPPVAITPDPASPPHAFVGSQNSTVYHRPECVHARRIKPENQVQFTTVEDARAAGRVPCQACRPDQP